MAYATALQFIEQYGLKETAMLLADEEGLVTEQLLKDAIAVQANGYWTGEPSEAEIDAANRALARLTRQLASASSLMDGYFGSAARLPLVPSAANEGPLRECCLALARCSLSDDADNHTEQMSQCCEGWKSWLKDISAGRVQLVGQDGQTMAPLGRVRFGAAASGYDFGAHASFGPRVNGSGGSGGFGL